MRTTPRSGDSPSCSQAEEETSVQSESMIRGGSAGGLSPSDILTGGHRMTRVMLILAVLALFVATGCSGIVLNPIDSSRDDEPQQLTGGGSSGDATTPSETSAIAMRL